MRQSANSIRCLLLLAAFASLTAAMVGGHGMTSAATVAAPVVSCIDGHLVEKLSECPTVVPRRPPPQERGTGGPRGGGGLLGGLLGGIL